MNFKNIMIVTSLTLSALTIPVTSYAAGFVKMGGIDSPIKSAQSTVEKDNASTKIKGLEQEKIVNSRSTCDSSAKGSSDKTIRKWDMQSCGRN